MKYLIVPIALGIFLFGIVILGCGLVFVGAGQMLWKWIHGMGLIR